MKQLDLNKQIRSKAISKPDLKVIEIEIQATQSIPAHIIPAELQTANTVKEHPTTATISKDNNGGNKDTVSQSNELEKCKKLNRSLAKSYKEHIEHIDQLASEVNELRNYVSVFPHRNLHLTKDKLWGYDRE